MSRLGARISVLLTLAILFVVAVATVLVLTLMGPPEPPGGRMARAAAELALIARASERLPESEWSALLGGSTSLRTEPPAGRADERRTREFAQALRRENVSVEGLAVEPDGGGPPIAGVKLADGRWLAFEGRPPRPDRNAWMGFGFWMALITIGTAGLVVFAVMRATRPLGVLERAVAAVGPDGEFVELPENGPPEVRAAARAINQLSRRLREAMESRMRLVAAAGHDLRTPMTRMRLRAEFLSDEDDREKWLADLSELDRIADSAILLVREEVDPDAANVERIDAMVREIAEELTEIGLPVRVTRTAEAVARVRPLAMRRALRNLVTNAATHGRSAAISVDVAGGGAVIAIEDDGPGIPPALLERAFEPFFRVDPARKATTPGAGLGLAIAKEIVGRNGGTLAIANRPSGGLVQVVTLPPASEAPTA